MNENSYLHKFLSRQVSVSCGKNFCSQLYLHLYISIWSNIKHYGLLKSFVTKVRNNTRAIVYIVYSYMHILVIYGTAFG